MTNPKALLVVLLVVLPLAGFAEDITLVKHARRVETVETAPYKVRSGDTLWKIFLRSFDAKDEDMPYLYKKFRELNPGVKNLNHIRVGQRLVIPRMPEQEPEMTVKSSPSDIYVIKQGQHLAMVLRDVYGLSDKLIFNEYLKLIQELNPEIGDLDHVEPGQAIKMPKLKELVSAVQEAEEKLAPVEEEEARIPTEEPVEPAVKVEEVSVVAQTPKGPPKPRKAKITEILTVDTQEVPETPPPQDEVKPLAAVPAENVPNIPESAKIIEQEPDLSPTAPQAGQESLTTEATPVEPQGRALESGSSGPATGEGAQATGEKQEQAARLVRNTLMPALQEMGGKQRDKGTYFMPMSGGSSISIDTSEIPVMELDTGKRIILDVNNKISKEIKDLLEKTFPSCRIISGPSGDLADLMDRVLNVSGYFSINRDAGPLLVGEEEKVRFFGKWIVYKDFSRHNVFVVNILSPDEKRTPSSIRSYAARFGIDLIEVGGSENVVELPGADSIRNMNHSYKLLLDELGVAYESDKVLDLVALDAVKIAYQAPLVVGSVILTEILPEETMLDLIGKKHYTVVHTADKSLKEVLVAIGFAPEGPPVRVVAAKQRTELELPALKVRDLIILESAIDRDIAEYLAMQGRQVLAW